PDPGAPLRDPLGHLRPPVHAVAPDAPRGAGRRRGGSQAPLPLAEDQPALVQAPLLHAGALPDLLPSGEARDRELPADTPAPARPPPTLGRRIARERTATLLPHVAAMAALWWVGGFGVLARVSLAPYFLFFPIAFALTRLGQHYAIDPADPAKWGTVMKPSRWWDFWYLSSAYHLEHHYFTGVPFYNLRRLHFALRPFFDSIGWKPVSYARLFRAWIFENQAPHTNWHLEG